MLKKIMLKTKSQSYKDSYINTSIAEYHLDNNRKLVVNTSLHNNNIYIGLRSWLRVQPFQGGHFIPTLKGLYISLEQWRTLWDDLDKQMRHLLDIDNTLVTNNMTDIQKPLLDKDNTLLSNTLLR